MYEGEIHSKNNPKVKKAQVDIDETICFYEGPRVYEKAVPDTKNIWKINKLFEEGWVVVYATSRGSSQPRNAGRMKYLRDLTEKQLKTWGCKYHHLVMGDEKPLYDLIVDDKAKRIEEL